MSIFRENHKLMILEKDNLFSIKKQIKKVSRDLWILRQRKEFEWSSIESHFILSNMEECQDCLNKLLYLFNRELISRKRRYLKNIAGRGYEADRTFHMNVPYDYY
ncbi:MAG: hypothetical protein FIB08_04135 [Candidatus Methanoperedens sp.]|nr:hypothetical protein [Candidatus Methanoperedens sp.]